MDNYYCLIRLIVQKNIILYFFKKNSTSYNYPICFTAYRADTLYKLMSIHNIFKNLSLRHCLYLGQEFYKAELCLKLGQEYVQD